MPTKRTKKDVKIAQAQIAFLKKENALAEQEYQQGASRRAKEIAKLEKLIEKSKAQDRATYPYRIVNISKKKKQD